MKPITMKRVADAFQALRQRSNWYPDDVRLIQGALEEAYGINLTEDAVMTYWRWYSDGLCASWLIPTRDEAIRWFPDFLEFCESGAHLEDGL